MTKIAGTCTGLQDCSVMQNSNFKRLKKGGKASKCVLIYEKVMKTWSIERERDAGGVTVKRVKKLRVEGRNASLPSGDKCK